MAQFQIVVLPGDGIGPEVVDEGLRVLEAVSQRFGHTFNLTQDLVGGAAIDAYGIALRPETAELCRKSHAVIWGAVGGPKWDDPQAPVRPEDGLLAIRKGLGLYANLRPVKVYPFLRDAGPIKPEVLEGVDMLVLRELTGGLYFGLPKKRWTTQRGRRGVDTMRYTELEIERILRVGFELARSRRKRLTSVDKANVLETSRLWRQIAQELSEEYSDVTVDHLLVDNCAMQLILNPSRFDVIVTENTFGDILTDEASVLAGSMGMLPSASLAGVPSHDGRRRARGMYEPIHGTAPDIAGQGKANPIAMVLSVALMLRYSLGLPGEADAVDKAVDKVLQEGLRTPDLITPGGHAATTNQMGQALADAVAAT
jgi:3-isopropylmalate dehydrogenase